MTPKKTLNLHTVKLLMNIHRAEAQLKPFDKDAIKATSDTKTKAERTTMKLLTNMPSTEAALSKVEAPNKRKSNHSKKRHRPRN